MIAEFLVAFIFVLSIIMMAYLVRHFVFSLTVLGILRRKELPAPKNIAYEPAVTVLIPAHNEQRVIGRILQRMTELTYPENKMQIIVIDDASTDDTGKIAEDYARRYSQIHVLRRSKNVGGKGKASALNSALGYAQHEIILCFDADYYPQKDVVERLVKPFSDPKVGAVQGRVTVLNEPQNIVTRLVTLERIGGYRVDQQARESLGLIAQFGGTVGGFRRTLIESLGGWDESVLAEDTDLTFSVYLAGFRVQYVLEAECYEEAVETWGAYWKQRYRWAKGHMQCCSKHMFKLFRSKNLSFKQKIDGLLLLNIYFMPVLAFFLWLSGISLFLLDFPQWINILWGPVQISLLSFMGNFAPFFEVGIGAYLDGRKRACWLIPLLIFTFLYNVLICTKAFFDLIVSKIFRKKHHSWVKTTHSGNGNCYIL